MKQLYDLGLNLKTYYKSFLPESFDYKKIYTRSTDFDRPLVSASAFLAGLYQPSKDQQWNPALANWLPTPVHTAPLKNDPLYNYDSACPYYVYLKNATLNSPEYQSFLNKNKDFTEFIMSRAGYKKIEFGKLYTNVFDNAINEVMFLKLKK